jgi:hypothetical protein
VNPLAESIETLGFTGPWTYLALFLAASLLMIWRFEALMRHGLEGTAVGTLVMPYCSGLGNLLFVAIVSARGESPSAVLTNCVVNNVTNLTVLLGLPALCFGLSLHADSAKKSRTRKAPGAARAATPGSTCSRAPRAHATGARTLADHARAHRKETSGREKDRRGRAERSAELQETDHQAEVRCS